MNRWQRLHRRCPGLARAAFALACSALALAMLSLAWPSRATTTMATASAVADSPPGVFAVGQAGQYTLTPAFEVLEDPGGMLDLQAVLGLAAQGRFASTARRGGTGNNFGITRSAFWLRLQLAPAPGAPADWLLEVAYPPLDRIDLYQSTPGASPAGAPGGAPGGSFRHQAAGDLLDFAARPIPHRNHVLPLQLQPGSATTLLLRVASQGTLAVPVRLWQPAALASHDQGDYALLSLYFGLLVGLLLYNLLLYVSVRDRVYLIYVGFVACLAITEAALTGFGAQFIWPAWTWWNSVAPPVGMAVSMALGVAFARNFLSSRARLPRLDRLMRALVFGCVLTGLAGLLLSYATASLMVTVLAATAIPTLVVAGVVSLVAGHPGARYFLTAWTLLLLGAAILALHNNGLVPSNLFTANALLVGSALEMLLLSFALADRINQVRAEKEQAQARSLAEHELVKSLQQAEQESRSALQRQQELNELRSRFVAMTSHEFRTPLATILSSAELLKYYGDRLPDHEKAEVLQGIENGVDRMTRMLDRVLLLGRAEAHMLEFKPQPTDLAALCHSLAEEAGTLLAGSRCTLATAFTDGLGQPLDALSGHGLYDEKLLRHIFANLLSNAIKYSPDGGEVRFTAMRRVDSAANGVADPTATAAAGAAGAATTVFTVSDQGIGIPASEIGHLFESFHRASNVGAIAGTGLGLAIVKQAVDLHGGQITVHSEPGAGTTFTVTL